MRLTHYLMLALLAVPLAAESVSLPLRTRVEVFKGSGQWLEATIRGNLDPAKTAIVICDMWDKHWCSGATGRVNELAPRIDKLIDAARRRGVLIIHAPSDTLDFYKAAPQRNAMLAIPNVTPPAPLDLTSPALPIDDSDGGCDTQGDKQHKAWTRQHAAIRIAENDLISDRGTEVYSALRARGIADLLIMGVHTNMCILNRGFAIKQMTKWGIRTVLVRDLTDAMYDPQDRPFVSHAQGTELVIQYIEKYWCPSVVSTDLLSAFAR